MDEEFRQEEESQSRVNQLRVPNLELQDKVSSLNDSKDFHGPETASSSGFFHVPFHPSNVLSPRGMPSRDFYTEHIWHIGKRF